MKLSFGVFLIVVGVFGPCRLVTAQNLVPLTDDVDVPLLPSGITSSDVEMFGELVYLWEDGQDANIVHFVGDFELQVGHRRMNADEAVIWMVRKSYKGKSYTAFEIVLWSNAQVVEAEGTVTRGPVLFATMNAGGRVRTSADRKTFASSRDTAGYQRALRVRTAARVPRQEASEYDGLTVIEFTGDATPTAVEAPLVSYQGEDTTIEMLDGQTIVTVIGDVYVFRGDAGGRDALELRADAAVVYLADGSSDNGEESFEDRPGRAGSRGTVEDDRGILSGIGREDTDAMGFGTAGNVEAVYLEGDIVLSTGDRSIRASRLYYDFANDRAIILDAVFRALEPVRQLPIYVRADEIRQLSARKFQAKSAKLTTSEFFTPHYHLGVEELTLIDRTRRDPILAEQSRGFSGSAKLKHSSFNLSGVPLLYWPYANASLRETETSIRSLRTGYSGDFGLELETEWALFNVLGLESPPGFDGRLLLDYFSERGPGAGVELDYLSDDYFGLYRGYYINDTGEDNLGGWLRDEHPDTEHRGRTTFRHRQYLPADWQLTFELSYVSDKNFLEEYFESEHDEAKEQESLIYLKKQKDNWAFTSLLQYRINDFHIVTERLPDFSFFLIGKPVGDFATWFSENRAGWNRYRWGKRDIGQMLIYDYPTSGSGTVARADTRQELEIPLAIGDLKLVPFASARGTAWDDSPQSGGVGRFFGSYGIRGSMYAWKVDPQINSELLDINGLRHIVKADIIAWGSTANLDSEDLYVFDETVEEVDEVDGVSFGLRQRFQTKRGEQGRQRVVDLLTFDLEVGLFNDADGEEYTNGFVSYSRPENSVTRNYANASMIYRVNDATQVLSEANFDLNDGAIDHLAMTLAVERTPRLSYLFGYRYIGELESNLLGAGVNYRINEKYAIGVREQFDLDRGTTAEFDIGIVRKFPRWYVGVTFAVDEVEDDLGVSMSIWPEGLPSAAIGSSRFTGLATSTSISEGFR